MNTIVSKTTHNVRLDITYFAENWNLKIENNKKIISELLFT